MTPQLTKIAVQKSGRIKEDSLSYLKSMGLNFDLPDRQIFAYDSAKTVQLFTMRSPDIIKSLEDGRVDIGIYGKDTWLESDKPNLKYKNLNFSKCRMSIAVPANSNYQSLFDLEGKTIATSYRSILQKKLDKKKIKANIFDMDGGVEMAPGVGWADAIFDIVGTGETLKANGLVEKDTLFKSNAIVVTRDDFTVPDNAILQQILMSKKEISAKNNKVVEQYQDYRYSDCRIFY